LKKCEEVPKKEKDTDLLKIQLLTDFYQSRFNFIASLFVGLFIGLAISGMTIMHAPDHF